MERQISSRGCLFLRHAQRGRHIFATHFWYACIMCILDPPCQILMFHQPLACWYGTTARHAHGNFVLYVLKYKFNNDMHIFSAHFVRYSQWVQKTTHFSTCLLFEYWEVQNMRNVNDTDRKFYELNVVDKFSWPMVDLVCTLGVYIASWHADSS